jgi:hypothetical protein
LVGEGGAAAGEALQRLGRGRRHRGSGRGLEEAGNGALELLEGSLQGRALRSVVKSVNEQSSFFHVKSVKSFFFTSN